MLKHILSALTAFTLILPAKALPGAGSARKVGAEILEELAQVASRESTDSAAKAATRRMAERMGRELPEVEALLTRYGDSLGLVLRNSERARLFNELGDEAAQAFIRNGAAAESVLTKIPSSGMAHALSQLNHADARYLDALVQRGQISAADSGDWLHLLKEKGSAVLSYAWNHPKVTAAALLAGGAGAYALTHPSTSVELAQHARGLLDLACAHPVLAACVVLLAVLVFLLLVNFIAEAPWALAHWLCRKLMGG